MKHQQRQGKKVVRCAHKIGGFAFETRTLVPSVDGWQLRDIEKATNRAGKQKKETE